MRGKSSAGRAGCSFGFSRMFISRPLISDCSDSADADEGIDENHNGPTDGPDQDAFNKMLKTRIRKSP